ncbi:MAG TPA: DUF6655 family protein [Candidatus Cybelea sp.]|nr:DUF6655 family protein [Candidatus Cybelea sp.]
MSRRFLPALALLCFGLAGCSLDRTTDPQRTATEELLISTAADRAAENMALDLGPTRKAFLDATNFEGLDSKYAIGAIRSSLLKHGTHFVQDKKDADTIVEIRSGALGIDKDGTLVGIPSFNLPIPLAGQLQTPEIAFYKFEEQQGIAKFGATAYDAKDGHFIAESTPPLGRSHLQKHVVLIVSWTNDDVHGNDGHGEKGASNTLFEP